MGENEMILALNYTSLEKIDYLFNKSFYLYEILGLSS